MTPDLLERIALAAIQLQASPFGLRHPNFGKRAKV
jgi:hypothetical protein